MVEIPTLSKRVKLQLFTSKTLERLSELYAMTSSPPNKAHTDGAASTRVRDLVHKLFVSLCKCAPSSLTIGFGLLCSTITVRVRQY